MPGATSSAAIPAAQPSAAPQPSEPDPSPVPVMPPPESSSGRRALAVGAGAGAADALGTGRRPSGHPRSRRPGGTPSRSRDRASDRRAPSRCHRRTPRARRAAGSWRPSRRAGRRAARTVVDSDIAAPRRHGLTDSVVRAVPWRGWFGAEPLGGLPAPASGMLGAALRVTASRPTPPGRKRSKGNRALPGARRVFTLRRHRRGIGADPDDGPRAQALAYSVSGRPRPPWRWERVATPRSARNSR